MYFLTCVCQCVVSCVATFCKKKYLPCLTQWPTYRITNCLQEL